jgi:omega-6 fatty acid desaturase (delta-12 desaturase)
MTDRRTDRALIDATRPYAHDSRARSWFYVVSTFALLALLTLVALRVGWWPLRLAASVATGLTIVRAFILFHDFLHGALLRGSRAAGALFQLFGVSVMTPPKVWRETHNYHHAHTAKIVGSNVGSYAMVTTEIWKRMSPRERMLYRLVRHPVTILLAYFTIFVLGMGVSPFLRAPKKHAVAGLAVLIHVTAWVAAAWLGVFPAFFFAFALPVMIACTMGAYLFYAQHNFPDMHVQPRESWSYARAALESSSFMEMGPVMRFFAGNIGYHHVHHLNPLIPFYRLPEAMAGIPELQSPGRTSLRPRDIVACFRLKLWDPSTDRMVGYPLPERGHDNCEALTP